MDIDIAASIKLTPVPGHRNLWIVLEDFTYDDYVIPRMFVTDLDSIPYIPFIYSWLKGYARTSSVIHDFGYNRTLATRLIIDRAFYKNMIEIDKVPKYIASVIYLAVRLFGGSFYKEHLKYDKETRVSRRMFDMKSGCIPMLRERLTARS